MPSDSKITLKIWGKKTKQKKKWAITANERRTNEHQGGYMEYLRLLCMELSFSAMQNSAWVNSIPMSEDR